MTQFVYEGRTKEQRTGHEKIAMQNIRHAINWIVGGYYNDYQDGNYDALPQSRNELEEIVYSESMYNGFGVGVEVWGRAPKEMRFAGEKFCRAYIAWKLDQDEDVKEIAEAVNW